MFCLSFGDGFTFFLTKLMLMGYLDEILKNHTPCRVFLHGLIDPLHITPSKEPPLRSKRALTYVKGCKSLDNCCSLFVHPWSVLYYARGLHIHLTISQSLTSNCILLVLWSLIHILIRCCLATLWSPHAQCNTLLLKMMTSWADYPIKIPER